MLGQYNQSMDALKQPGCTHRLGKWEVHTASLQIRRCVECGKVVESAPMPLPEVRC